ncbi:hypothetical protein [Oscillibacter ruminantium]|jgi:hypothetical protein|nr:hypothetical protein [Oscillibacter ruminantium]MDN0033270.1 hypothetical protein [Oscillibacter valericigenes]
MGIHSFHASVFDTLEFDIQRKRQKQSEDEPRLDTAISIPTDCGF